MTKLHIAQDGVHGGRHVHRAGVHHQRPDDNQITAFIRGP
jgi:hypothetical protein